MFKPALAALVAATLLFAVFAIYVFRKNKKHEYTSVTINEHVINVEVANSPTTRAKGLMYKEKMPEDSGMLFIFPSEGKHRFWMANTYIYLDIIWISADKTIVHVEENLPPCTKTGKLQSLCTTYKSAVNAKYVLEVNAGWVAENSVVIGNKVGFTQ